MGWMSHFVAMNMRQASLMGPTKQSQIERVFTRFVVRKLAHIGRGSGGRRSGRQFSGHL